MLGTLAAWGAFARRRALGYPALPSVVSVRRGFLGEWLATSMLVYVFLNVTTIKGLAGSPLFGLAIGVTVTSMLCAAGSFTGGAFNPAVGLIGPFTGGQAGSIEDVWIYWAACPVAALGAAGFFMLQNLKDFRYQDYTPHFEPPAPWGRLRTSLSATRTSCSRSTRPLAFTWRMIVPGGWCFGMPL